MRTAEEIIKERYPFYDENIDHKDVELNGEQVSALINTARREALEEAAEAARLLYHDGTAKQDRSGLKYFQSGSDNIKPDKQSILDLINELR